jgi:hypothetical protein
MLENIADVGHVLIYGQTYSGKTYFCKYFLKLLKPKDIYVFTTVPKEWQGYEVYTEDFDNNINTILTNTEKTPGSNFCDTIIIFDDFNKQINTQSNKKYNELFTSGRHKGIRVINLAHQAKAIGPTVRANVRYAIIMSSASQDEVDELAKICFDNDKIKLRKIVTMAVQENEYNAVVVDKNTRKFKAYLAPKKKKSNVPVSDGENEIIRVIPRIEKYREENTFNKTIDIIPHPDSSLMQNPVGSIETMLPPTREPVGPLNQANSFGTKYANNMIDNSNNNFNVDQRIQFNHLVETNIVKNEIRMQNLEFDKEYRVKQMLIQAVELIDKPRLYRTHEEKLLIAQAMNMYLKPKKLINDENYEKLIPLFMKRLTGRVIETKSSPLDKMEKIVDVFAKKETSALGMIANGFTLFNNWNA